MIILKTIALIKADSNDESNQILRRKYTQNAGIHLVIDVSLNTLLNLFGFLKWDPPVEGLRCIFAYCPLLSCNVTNGKLHSWVNTLLEWRDNPYNPVYKYKARARVACNVGYHIYLFLRIYFLFAKMFFNVVEPQRSVYFMELSLAWY